MSPALERREKGTEDRREVVGDRTSGRICTVTGETRRVAGSLAGVGALIVAEKRGNSRGAKGGRKMDEDDS